MSGSMSLTFCLAVLCAFLPAVAAASTGEAESPFGRLSDQEAWKRLPAVESGGGGPLPSWARALAGSLPHTTAVMLDLDRTYRTSDSLDPKLAAAIRLAVARTIRSDYGRAYAEADLRRAGLDQAAIDRLSGDRSELPAAERAALAFAERMTTAGYTSTDAEVAGLVESFGEAKVVAIVLQIAYSNFLFRMAQALGLPLEASGALPPVDVHFARPSGEAVISTDVPAAPRPQPASGGSQSGEPKPKVNDPEWTELRFDELQRRLEAQRGRAARVSIPTWEEFRKVLPPSLYPRAKPLRIRWSLLVSGRQPLLGPAWIKTTRTFGSESKQDRVFEESLFWVVTRSLRCFYCMGHCEMLLEVAGLPRDEISRRTALLASGDWSSFPPAEQAAFAFAQADRLTLGDRLCRHHSPHRPLRPRTRARCRLVVEPLPVHDQDLGRLPAPARARQRVCRLSGPGARRGKGAKVTRTSLVSPSSRMKTPGCSSNLAILTSAAAVALLVVTAAPKVPSPTVLTTSSPRLIEPGFRRSWRLSKPRRIKAGSRRETRARALRATAAAAAHGAAELRPRHPRRAAHLKSAWTAGLGRGAARCRPWSDRTRSRPMRVIDTRFAAAAKSFVRPASLRSIKNQVVTPELARDPLVGSISRRSRIP